MQVENLVRQTTFLKEAPKWLGQVIRSPEGLTWFLKAHRAKLLAEGAVIKIGREYFIESEKFIPIARQIMGLPQ